MLRKKQRVQIQNFPKSAKSVFSGDSIVVKINRGISKPGRVGVIIKKGAVKSSVKRNAIKRRVFAFFEDEQDFLKKTNSDILVIVNKLGKLDDKDYEGLTKELGAAINKLK